MNGRLLTAQELAELRAYHAVQRDNDARNQRSPFTLRTQVLLTPPKAMHPLADPERRELYELRAAVRAVRDTIATPDANDVVRRLEMQRLAAGFPELTKALAVLFQVKRNG